MKNVVALAVIALVTVAASSCGKEQARRQSLNQNQFGAQQQGMPGFNNGGLNVGQQPPTGLQQSPIAQNTNLVGYWYAQVNGTLYLVGRVLQALSCGRARLIRYYIVAQPVPNPFVPIVKLPDLVW
jgi:hypothetical protein